MINDCLKNATMRQMTIKRLVTASGFAQRVIVGDDLGRVHIRLQG